MLPTTCSSRRSQTKTAEKMDNMQQGGCNKTISSIRAGQNRDKTITKREARSRAERTREDVGITPPIQTKGRREMYMRT